MSMVAEHVDDTETLGRCCFERKEAGRRNPRGRFIRRSFINGLMSVDRLESADIQVLCTVHDAEAVVRKPPRIFHGWYVFTVASVRATGWDVQPDPTCVNPWHAEVCLPDLLEQEDDLLQNCNRIASQASWRARPLSLGDEEFLSDVGGQLGLTCVLKIFPTSAA